MRMTDRTSMVRVDAHQHVWSIESGLYDWPTPAESELYRSFAMPDVLPSQRSSRIDRSILVQAANSLADTDRLIAEADRHGTVAAVVGWLPLDDPAAAEAALEAREGQPISGIRHLIHRESDPDWLDRPTLAGGFDLLGQRRLAFDVVAVFPDHLPLVPKVADRHPDVTFVIDHLAKPPFRADGWDRWSTQLSVAAARPNVYAKLSGLDTAAGPGWSIDEITPAIDLALEAFGPDRLMFGSDWPVCRLVSTYGQVVDAIDASVSRLSGYERASIMGGTAIAAYRLDISG
jgi:L-fucono-1,5-lactonase